MVFVNRFLMLRRLKRAIQGEHDRSRILQVPLFTQRQAFLSEEMQYSCPIWGDEEGGVRGDLTGQRTYGDLERAQERKIGHILKKARLRPGHRLLEIGSGWGSLAIAVGLTFDLLTKLNLVYVLGSRDGMYSRFPDAVGRAKDSGRRADQKSRIRVPD
ncbi:hypothetical protein EDD18DRAFT_388001 [Armillaria luteobubalina]|uniref:Cyclopropane-fatty-acyl-phospholipid synthase n=1 Tax=Armillaria luteobubalina TaxID=153913 RepID=A0AA39NWF9_9AGAR|nr:hypothetical protein EDD18DRAFT_388001 [Armillaria luteobubalina]